MTTKPSQHWSQRAAPAEPVHPPIVLLTYAEAAELLRVDKRTLRRRIARGRYVAYGQGSGKRVLYNSIVADIRRECGEVQ